MTTSIIIDYKKLIENLLEAFNYHVLGDDTKAYELISKAALKKSTDKDDFLRHFREGLENFFQGMSLSFENVEYARHKAISSLTHFNSALESMFEFSYSHPPEELEEQVIAQIYKTILFKLEKDKKAGADPSVDHDIKRIKQALTKWRHQAPVKANQEEIFRFLLLLFAKSIAHITILVKLEPWPKDIQKKRGWREPKIKDELERLLNIFTFIHLVAKNSHKLPVVIERKVSRLFGAMGYFYRGKVFFLLSDFDRDNFRRAFNDFTIAEKIVIHEVQDIVRKKKKSTMAESWKWLSASIYFAEGYLYQRAFAYNQAFESFADGMTSYRRYLERGKKDKNYKSLTIVQNEVAQGKIFIELGKFRSALKQFLKALERLFVIAQEDSNSEALIKNLASIRNVIDLLEGARQDVIFYKENFFNELKKFDPNILFEQVFHPLRLLASDICARIGFVIYLLFYKSDNPEKYAKLGADIWMEVALKLDPNNGLAQFNRMLSGTKKKISTADLTFRNDSSIRRFIAYALETLVNSPNHQELEEEREFFKKSITYSDTLVKKPLEINYYLSPDKKETKDGLLFLKRWSSSSPRVPRPTTFQMRGGGYIVFWNNKGIAIDPGFDFITNLYSEGYSISDIDAIIVTHDHIDHTDDFDAILALNYQLNRYNESTYLKPKKPVDLSLFLNTGFMEKYTSYLSLNTKRGGDSSAQGDGYIDHIYTLAPHSTIDMTDTPFQLKVEVIPARHREITLDKYAVGFKLHLYDKGERRATLGFTSDTAYYDALGNKFKDCEIVIPHIGFVTFRELGQLLELEIDKIIKSASSNYFSDIEEELRFFSALGFRDVKSWEDLSTKWNSKKTAQHQGFLRQHLGYSGVKKVWQKMTESKMTDQLMIISELHEEMGSFRSKLASAFNHKAKKVENAPLSFTSDIGLHLLFEHSKNKFESKIRCESCARDNDLDTNETFHSPENIKEVCVKGEKEGIYYFCKEHAPDSDKEFREKVERFKLFG